MHASSHKSGSRRQSSHIRTESKSGLLSKSRRESIIEEDEEEEEEEEEEPLPPSPSKSRHTKPSHHSRSRHSRSTRAPESEAGRTTSRASLSSKHLAQLDKENSKKSHSVYDRVPRKHHREYEDETIVETVDDREERERRRRREERRQRRREREAAERADAEAEAATVRDYEVRRYRRKERVASGQTLERGPQSHYGEKEEYRDESTVLDLEEANRKKVRLRNMLILVAVFAVLVVIGAVIGVVVSKKNKSSSGGGSGGSSGTSTTASGTTPSNSNLNGMSESDIPTAYQGTYLDPFTWYDTQDFNVTFTAQAVGGLSVMGLNSTWDDSTRANSNVPPLNESWNYGKELIHGVNLGGWLSIEPVITPSLFSQFTTHDNVVDEYTLCQKLGAMKAKTILEQHYSSFVTEQTFADIAAAGLDHVRIPYSYWAVKVYDGDPYVPQVSWRYLLRGIEWARKHGLRINLDLHGAPGSQNGWNHSGRQGTIGWLNGTDGALNGQRTVDLHTQLSTFFTQPRYKNIITMYGLVNEPRMVELDTKTVLDWTHQAIEAVQDNGFEGIIIFGDGFMGLDNWQGKLTGINNLLLDVHQYVIFNVDQIVLNHHDKINFACGGWTAQALRSENTATGFGPTLCGEWSQADTDCATYLNNVGVGSRWEGTLNMVNTPGGSLNGSVLTPTCPTDNSPRCSCENANADPSSWSAEYKAWLLMFAEAQMHSFEQGWGWFYWTWQMETAAQWSYSVGLQAGVLPKLAYQRDFDCSQQIPDFASLGLPEYY
ncbi:glycoside hydrolase family 5 protein [Acrodontium crateriforme]|uniref:glucan 1,3-beta-glucosidase n=1 Tax=Acrodontium crateriforme TaxID=150365 RepID=A0AAQ3M9R0_9PEZI|nr:glycoside hydrolase family 5 protein [Acrodontium crateriforme]